MLRALPPIAVVCLIGIEFAMNAGAHHYGETHPALTIAALLGVIISAVCVAVLLPKARRLIRRRDHFADSS